MDLRIDKGRSLAESLHEILTDKSQRVFLVRGGESFVCCGADGVCRDLLQGIFVTEFRDFSVNPKIEDVRKGIELFKAATPDLVLAVGGGSVIDMAKAILALGEVEDDLESYVRGEKVPKEPAAKLVAVPTTSGTGSEATHFAVVYIGKEKYSLAHSWMQPHYVILDPKLTESQSSYVAACTGLDALAQAIESMWSTGATAESKAYAKEAIGLIIESFEKVITNPTLKDRRLMQYGAYLAGKAINISKTTASHAMSYALTSHYNIPHGHAVALTLGELLVFNSEAQNSDLQDTVDLESHQVTMKEIYDALGVTDANSACELINDLMSKSQLEVSLSKFGVLESDLDKLSQEVSAERAKNNPRKFGEEEAKLIYKKIF